MRNTLVCLLLVACTQKQPLPVDETGDTFALGVSSRDVFIDSIANGFSSWSWSGTYDFTGGVITAQVTRAWGALSLAASAPTPVSNFSTLSFSVKGNAGAVILVSLEPASGAFTEEIPITLAAGWTDFDVPVGQIDSGAANFRTVCFKSATAQTFYVDNIRLNVPPAITAFSASGNTLHWTTSGVVQSVKINGVATPNDGTENVSPAQTTTYTLQVTGLGGTSSRQTTITVTPPPPPPPAAPTIATFTASPSSLTSGQSATLTWTTSGSITSATLNGAATANDGNEPVSPTATTTYTLTVVGPGGTATKTTTISVSTPPPPPPPPANTRDAFTDAYQNGWSRTTDWFNVYEVGSGAIHLVANSGATYLGLQLATTQPFAVGTYARLHIRARGTGTFSIETPSGGYVEITLGGTDKTYSIPTASFFGATVAAFDIKNVTASAEAFIDSIQFGPAEGCAGALPATPLTTQHGDVATFVTGGKTHWVAVPADYDNECHSRPKKLFVWLHGCGGRGQYDIYNVMPNADEEDWIALAVGGAEGACWGSSTASAIVLAAIADLKTRLAIKPREVILGGYSSGGDVGYPILFKNASTFALALFENTAPWGDNGQNSSLANSPAWRFPVRHLCHDQDEISSYKCSALQPILGNGGTLDNLGHDSVLHELDGTHWQNDANGRGTWADFAAVLRPYLLQTWQSPQ